METEQIPYACGRLHEISELIGLHTEHLTPLRQAGDHTAMKELAGELQKIAIDLREAILLLQELGASSAAVYTAKLCAAVCSFHIQSSDYTKFTATLAGWRFYIHPLLPDAERKTVSAAVVGRMMNTVRMGYYPTDSAHVAYLKQALRFPQGKTVNLLDPCCGEGKALAQLAENEQAVTYGAELDESRAETAQIRLDRVALGSYYFARISRSVFHAMLLNPPYLQLHGGTRSEKRFLGESYDHLMMGGVLCYIVPYYRLTEDVCSFLAAHFGNISVFRFSANEFQKFRQIAVLGKRKPRTDDQRTAMLLQNAAIEPQRIPLLETITPGSYPLPEIERAVPLFQGAQFNLRELAGQMAQMGSMLPKKVALDATEKRPPLPLTIGQIGLVGGSGLINGLIECDTPHVIKGRIVKVRNSHTADVVRGPDGSKTTETVETVSNKMVFNMLTLNGVQELT